MSEKYTVGRIEQLTEARPTEHFAVGTVLNFSEPYAAAPKGE